MKKQIIRIKDKRFVGKKILLMEGFGRQILPYLKAYKELGCVTTVLCGSKLDLAYFSRYADKKILGICNPERYSESEKYIVNLIKNGNYDVVVPMGDFAASILAKNKISLSNYAHIAVNEKEVFEKAIDKKKVMDICMKNNIPCPKTLIDENETFESLLKNVDFPVVIKPRSESGAKGFNILNTSEELSECLKTKDMSEYLVQEYIPQSNRNYSVGLFIDNNGMLKSSYIYASRRWYPLKGGTGTLNELIINSRMVDRCFELATIMGLQGVVGFDLIEDPRDKDFKVIEINPRVLACAKIGFEAGVNQALQLIEKELNYDVEEIKCKKMKLYIRMSQIDVLWFIKSKNRFKCNPSWFRIKNTKDQTFSLSDPLPWFAFLIRGMFNYNDEMKKRT